MCKHQWIEIKRLETYSKKLNEEINKGDRLLVASPPDRKGILIICANCEEQKELWERD